MPRPSIPDLFASMNLVVLREKGDGSFQPVGTPPQWSHDLGLTDASRAVNVEERALFLEDFLIDARDLWNRGQSTRVESGPWTEVDRSGNEVALNATAILQGKQRFLVIERLCGQFAEKQVLLQKARESSIAFQRLQGLADVLRRSESEARVVLQALPDGMFRLRRDGSYFDFGSSLRTAGAGASDLNSPRTVQEALPRPLAKEMMALVDRALDRGGIQILEYQLERAGKTLDLEARIAVCGVDEVLVLVRDITERKAAETELAERLSQLRSKRDDLLLVLNQLRIGAAVINEEGACVFLSDPTLHLFGIQADQVVGRRWDELAIFPQPHRRTLKEMMARPEKLRSRLPLHWEQSNGKRFWIEADIRDDPRHPVRKVVFLYDVSEIHDLRQMLDQKGHFENLVGKSEPMQQVYKLIQDLSRVDSTVLIEGETGTGKELVARAVHARSHRRDKPFLALNCAGLTESLVGSQLFGHKRGSFTGAVEDSPGLFEAAHGGTLFLDEIGEIPSSIQTSLLRVLQEREITRIGESKVRKVDVRVLAATHRNLVQEVERGGFRADLFYRIRVARIQIPPLRERREDIALLTHRFLGEFRAATGKPVQQISPEALRRLVAYAWPGNVRELRSALEFAVIGCDGEVVDTADLPPELHHQSHHPTAEESPLFHQDERQRLLAALERAQGNRTLAAQLLGIGRATLYRRMAALNIPTSSRDSTP